MLTNKIRIIAGKWRGRKLPFPDAPGLRPTLDHMRETLFNWLMHDIADARCLDLFAGSGAMGLESLSRGAAHVTFVDNSKKVINQLEKNCDLLNCYDQVELHCADAINYLKKIHQQFDIIFVDPPFHQNLVGPICQLLVENEILAPNAYIYIETELKLDTLHLPSLWQVLKHKKAGQVLYYLAQNSKL